jgi:probable HAF family extracellular repeat protein
VPKAINNCGEICGTGKIEVEENPGFVKHGFFWDGGQMHDIGVIPPFNESFGNDVSDHGQVVGYLNHDDYPYTAFLWQNGAMFDLNDLVIRVLVEWRALFGACSVAPSRNGSDDGAIACKEASRWTSSNVRKETDSACVN